MFKYLRFIENINRYDASDKLIYLTNGKKDERTIFYNGESLLSNVVDFVRKLKGELVFYTWDLKVYKKDNSELKILLNEYGLYDEKYDDETIIVSKKESIDNYIKSLYNFKTEKFIRDIKNIPKIIKYSFEITTSGNIIRKFSLLTNSNDWEIDLGGRKYLDVFGEEKDVKIVKLLGIESGQLIVFMNSNELISIDIDTGSIRWETKDFIKNNLPAYKDNRMTASIFYYCVLENGKLYQLDGNIYYSLDLKTQEVEILWEDKTENEYITCKRKTYTEDYVYFTGSRGGRFSSYLLGAFNRKTLQMDWVHQPEGIVNPLTNAPQYVDGKLYILDSGGILHIYERE